MRSRAVRFETHEPRRFVYPADRQQIDQRNTRKPQLGLRPPGDAMNIDRLLSATQPTQLVEREALRAFDEPADVDRPPFGQLRRRRLADQRPLVACGKLLAGRKSWVDGHVSRRGSRCRNGLVRWNYSDYSS